MNFYKLRVDLKTLQPDKIISIIADSSESYIYSIEGGDSNPHIHFYLASHIKKEAIRVKIRSLNLKGNRDYSFSTLDERYPIDYIAYILKDGNYKVHNVPDQIINEALAKCEEYKTEHKTKKRQTTADKIIESIPEEIKQNIAEAQFSSDYNIITKYLFTLISKYYITNGLSVRKFIIQSTYMNVASKLIPKVFDHHIEAWAMDFYI